MSAQGLFRRKLSEEQSSIKDTIESLVKESKGPLMMSCELLGSYSEIFSIKQEDKNKIGDDPVDNKESISDNNGKNKAAIHDGTMSPNANTTEDNNEVRTDEQKESTKEIPDLGEQDMKDNIAEGNRETSDEDHSGGKTDEGSHDGENHTHIDDEAVIKSEEVFDPTEVDEEEEESYPEISEHNANNDDSQNKQADEESEHFLHDNNAQPESADQMNAQESESIRAEGTEDKHSGASQGDPKDSNLLNTPQEKDNKEPSVQIENASPLRAPSSHINYEESLTTPKPLTDTPVDESKTDNNMHSKTSETSDQSLLSYELNKLVSDQVDVPQTRDNQELAGIGTHGADTDVMNQDVTNQNREASTNNKKGININENTKKHLKGPLSSAGQVKRITYNIKYLMNFCANESYVCNLVCRYLLLMTLTFDMYNDQEQTNPIEGQQGSVLGVIKDVVKTLLPSSPKPPIIEKGTDESNGLGTVPIKGNIEKSPSNSDKEAVEVNQQSVLEPNAQEDILRQAYTAPLPEMNMMTQKIQTLELQLLHLENHVLKDKLNKTNDTQAFSKIENHVLKLENQLLKINHSYTELKYENMRIMQSQKTQNQQFKAAAQQSSALQENNKSLDLISKHQSRIAELSHVLQQQTFLIGSINARTAELENQNRALHETINKQALQISEILRKLDNFSPEKIVHKVSTVELKHEGNNLEAPDVTDGKPKDSSQNKVSGVPAVQLPKEINDPSNPSLEETSGEINNDPNEQDRNEINDDEVSNEVNSNIDNQNKREPQPINGQKAPKHMQDIGNSEQRLNEQKLADNPQNNGKKSYNNEELYGKQDLKTNVNTNDHLKGSNLKQPKGEFEDKDQKPAKLKKANAELTTGKRNEESLQLKTNEAPKHVPADQSTLVNSKMNQEPTEKINTKSQKDTGGNINENEPKIHINTQGIETQEATNILKSAMERDVKQTKKVEKEPINANLKQEILNHQESTATQKVTTNGIKSKETTQDINKATSNLNHQPAKQEHIQEEPKKFPSKQQTLHDDEKRQKEEAKKEKQDGLKQNMPKADSLPKKPLYTNPDHKHPKGKKNVHVRVIQTADFIPTNITSSLNSRYNWLNSLFHSILRGS